MTKTRKLYKLRHYKTRRNKIKRNKIKRNKKSLRKGLRKRRKTKKLRGGSIVFTKINKELSKIKNKLKNNLTEKELLVLKNQIDELNNETIIFDGQELDTKDTRYKTIKNRLMEYGISVDTKLNTLSETPESETPEPKTPEPKTNVKELISIYDSNEEKSENKNNSDTLDCLNKFKTRFSKKMTQAKGIIDDAKKCGKSDV